MRRYVVSIEGTDHIPDVEELGPDTFVVELADGRRVEARLTGQEELAQAVIAPQIGTPAAHSAHHAQPAHPGHSAPRAPGAQPAQLAQPPARAPRATAGMSGAAVTAPMPGVILSVAVGAGDTVHRGQTLLVLEAMKMRNDIKAQRDGVVSAVHVKAADQVRHGDPLIDYAD